MQTATNHINSNPSDETMEDFALLEQRVNFYHDQLENHPIKSLILKDLFSKDLALEFAKLQYIDSVLWVPMLALMKDRVTNKNLHKALRANLMCEAGINHQSHITLCKEFLESIGIAPYMGDFEMLSGLAKQPVEIMNSVGGLSEAEIAGWILVAEALVPSLFRLFRPCFARMENADLKYLDEHIVVDSDEHAAWMYQAAKDLLQNGTCVRHILAGIDLGGRTALAVPDVLFAKARRQNPTPMSSGVMQ